MSVHEELSLNDIVCKVLVGKTLVMSDRGGENIRYPGKKITDAKVDLYYDDTAIIASTGTKTSLLKETKTATRRNFSMVSKPWVPVLEALEKQNRVMYYLGATLCIDLDHGRGVGLNLGGKGFTYAKGSPLTKDTTLYIPEEILEYVKIFYLEYKNNMEYYEEIEGKE